MNKKLIKTPLKEFAYNFNKSLQISLFSDFQYVREITEVVTECPFALA